MSREAKIYLVFLTLCGLTISIYSITHCISLLMTGQVESGLGLKFFVLFCLCVLCRALPIYIYDDGALDISFISILSSVILLGPVWTVALVTLSTPFVVEVSRRKGDPVRHIFNVPLQKTLFNLANWTISIYLPGLVFQALNPAPGTVLFPQSLPPVLTFISLSLPLNALILILLFHIKSGKSILKELLNVLRLLFPNMLAVTPIGLLMAYLLTLPNGPYLAVLFLAPLLLARYAFKLYLNSKQEQYILVQTLVATIEAKDKYTEGHSKRVSTYAERIARAMKLSSAKLEEIKVAALLHDVGKIGISDAILNKPGALSPEERITIQQHPLISVKILEQVELPGRTKEIILRHHERYDGEGYPNRTDKETTPLGAFILSVADAYDAMTSDRSYRSGMPRNIAVKILKENRGTQFHPEVVNTFVKLLEQESASKEDTE